MNQILNFYAQDDKSKLKPLFYSDTKILYISGKFFDVRKQRHIVITFHNGVRANLYIAPPRQQKATTSICEDDISIYSVEPSPVGSCLAQIDFLQSKIAPKYKPELLSKRYELSMPQPFKTDLSIAHYQILSIKSSNLLSAFVVE
jgi:hypothetical protein